jgi:endonuclease-3
MPTAITKQRVFQHVFAALAKTGKAEDPSSRPVLEQFIYAVCREGVTRDMADRAFRNLTEQYFDWNEIRVSSSRELAESLDCLPNAEARGQRIIDFLQEVFETTYSFDLEILQKKGVKQAAKQLSRYQSASDYAVASVIQNSLGGHAIPLDDAALRVVRRLGILDGTAGDMESLRASLEHQVPKAKAAAFCDTISEIAAEYCLDEEPRCSACHFCPSCPTGQDLKGSAAAETHQRTKPR